MSKALKEFTGGEMIVSKRFFYPLFTVVALCLLYAILYNSNSITYAQSAQCPQKSMGDANCDGRITVADYEVWRREFSREITTTDADFNTSGSVTLSDFEIWRRSFTGAIQNPSATSIPTTIITTSPTTIPSQIPTTLPPPIGSGIFISREEISRLPTSGSGWSHVLSAANSPISNPSLSQRGSDNTSTYAKALVYARTGSASYRQQVRDALGKIIGTEKGNDILAILRNTAAYVIAADVIDLKSFDPAFDQTFRNWLRTMRNYNNGDLCGSIVNCHEERPNNFGTHAAASRISIARYLGDNQDLARAALVQKGWMGDRSSYSGFSYHGLDWQCNPNAPVGINPKGCTKNGQTIDGVLPDDQRRGGGFAWPPFCENYVWGTLQGGIVAAELLHRSGYPAWEWQDKAMLRAFQWLYNTAHCSPSGDDYWLSFLVNKVYGTNFSSLSGRPAGTALGFADWTHAR